MAKNKKISKNLVKETLRKYKERFPYILLIDLIFFSVLVLFLAYSRGKIQGYINSIQQLTPTLTSLQSALQSSTDQAMLLQLDSLLNSINGILREAFIFGYLVVPVSILLLWSIFQGINYKMIKESKLRNFLDFRYFLKFLIFTIPFFAISILVLIKSLELFSRYVGYYGGIEKPGLAFYALMATPFIAFYFVTIIYSYLGESGLANLFKKTYHAGIKRVYITLPLFLPFLLSWALLMIVLTNIYITYIADSFKLNIFMLYTLLIVAFIGIYRVFFATFLENL